MIAVTMKNGTDVNGDHPIVRRFRNFAALSQGGEARLRSLASEPPRAVAADRGPIREGERRDGVHLILSGWACAYKMLEHGRRQTAATCPRR